MAQVKKSEVTVETNLIIDQIKVLGDCLIVKSPGAKIMLLVQGKQGVNLTRPQTKIRMIGLQFDVA